jgi:hypothetical protein
MSEPSDLDYESEEEYFIPAGERDDELLNNKLTRERAKRLLDPSVYGWLACSHESEVDGQSAVRLVTGRGLGGVPLLQVLVAACQPSIDTGRRISLPFQSRYSFLGKMTKSLERHGSRKIRNTYCFQGQSEIRYTEFRHLSQKRIATLEG